MTAPAAQPIPAVPQTTRVRVFVDYWNFQLTLNEREAAARHLADFRFLVDWKKLGPWLAKEACGTVGLANHTFDGVIIGGGKEVQELGADLARSPTWRLGALSRAQAALRVQVPGMPPVDHRLPARRLREDHRVHN
jgi:hypothetical protein